MEKGFEIVNLHGTASGIIPIPYIGENGNWYLGNDNTGVKAAGPQGERGEMGPEGQQGPKGDSPELVDNLQETVPGKALDATMGKVLDEKITQTDEKLGGLSFGQDAEGNWGYKAPGADTVVPFNNVEFAHISYPFSENAVFGTKAITTPGKPRIIIFVCSTSATSASDNFNIFSIWCAPECNHGNQLTLFRGAPGIKNITNTGFQVSYTDGAAKAEVYYTL